MTMTDRRMLRPVEWRADSRKPWAGILAAVGMAITCVACGEAFLTKLTANTAEIAAAPIFEVTPAGATALSDPALTGTSTSFRIQKRWDDVSTAAFHEVLRTATQDHQVRFSNAGCVGELDGHEAFTIVEGFTTVADYSVSVRYRFSGGELTLAVGGPNDMEKRAPPRTTQPFEDLLAAAPALDSESCTEEQLQELSIYVR